MVIDARNNHLPRRGGIIQPQSRLPQRRRRRRWVVLVIDVTTADPKPLLPFDLFSTTTLGVSAFESVLSLTRRGMGSVGAVLLL
jgi:hypothetical protein